MIIIDKKLGPCFKDQAGRYVTVKCVIGFYIGFLSICPDEIDAVEETSRELKISSLETLVCIEYSKLHPY